MDYGKRMKEIRTYDLYTQSFVAEKIGLKPNAYTQFECQNRIIPLEYLNKFCNFFNVSLDYVLGLNSKEKYADSKRELDFNLFITRIQEYRNEKKLSQSALAMKTGIPRTSISTYENNNCPVSTKSLYKICSKCGLSADYLLGRSDNPKYLK